MKKFIALLLSFIMIFTIIPSTTGPAALADDPEPTPTETPAPTPEPTPSEMPAPTEDPYYQRDFKIDDKQAHADFYFSNSEHTVILTIEGHQLDPVKMSRDGAYNGGYIYHAPPPDISVGSEEFSRWLYDSARRESGLRTEEAITLGDGYYYIGTVSVGAYDTTVGCDVYRKTNIESIEEVAHGKWNEGDTLGVILCAASFLVTPEVGIAVTISKVLNAVSAYITVSDIAGHWEATLDKTVDYTRMEIRYDYVIVFPDDTHISAPTTDDISAYTNKFYTFRIARFEIATHYDYALQGYFTKTEWTGGLDSAWPQDEFGNPVWDMYDLALNFLMNSYIPFGMHNELGTCETNCKICGTPIHHEMEWREAVIYNEPGVPLGHTKVCKRPGCDYVEVAPEFHHIVWNRYDCDRVYCSGYCSDDCKLPSAYQHPYHVYKLYPDDTGLETGEILCSRCGYGIIVNGHVDINHDGICDFDFCKLPHEQWEGHDVTYGPWEDFTSDTICRKRLATCSFCAGWTSFNCDLWSSYWDYDKEHNFVCSSLYCTDCGYEKPEGVVAPHHDSDQPTIVSVSSDSSVCKIVQGSCDDCGATYTISTIGHSYTNCGDLYCNNSNCYYPARPSVGILYDDGHVYTNCPDTTCNRAGCDHTRSAQAHYNNTQPTVVTVGSATVCQRVEGHCAYCGATFTLSATGHIYTDCSDRYCNTCYYDRGSVSGYLDNGHVYTDCPDTLCNRPGCGHTRAAQAHLNNTQPAVVTVGSASVCQRVDGLCVYCGATFTLSTTSHIYTDCSDRYCNTCYYDRGSVSGILYADKHVYTNCSDTVCNRCGHTRSAVAHVYTNCVDATCNKCGVSRTAPGHSGPYDIHIHKVASSGTCTQTMGTCSVCGYEYVLATDATHSRYSSTATPLSSSQHYHTCLDCGYKKPEPHNWVWVGFNLCSECGYRQ